jgi:hypothetical protein
MNDILTLSVKELDMLAKKHNWHDFIQLNQSWVNESAPLLVLTVSGVETLLLQRWLEQNFPEQPFLWQELQSETGLELLVPKLLVVFACDRLISGAEMEAVARVCGSRPQGSNAFVFAHPERLPDAAALEQLDKGIWNLFSDLQGNWKLVNLNEFFCYLWSGTEHLPEWLQPRLSRDTNALLDFLKSPVDECFDAYRVLSLLTIAEERLAASNAIVQIRANQDVEQLIQSLDRAERHLWQWLQEDANLQEQRVQILFDQLERKLQSILERNLAGVGANISVDSLTTELRHTIDTWKQQALISLTQWPLQRQERALQSLEGINWRRIHELIDEAFYPEQLIAIFQRENPSIVDYLHFNHLPKQQFPLLQAEPLLLGIGTAIVTVLATSFAGLPLLGVALSSLAVGTGITLYQDQQQRSQLMQKATAAIDQVVQDEYRKVLKAVQNYAKQTERNLRETLDQLSAELARVASSPHSYSEADDYQRVTELRQMVMNQFQDCPRNTNESSR